MYFFFTLYSLISNYLISSKKSPWTSILSSSVAEHEQANFLLSFLASYFPEISKYLKNYQIWISQKLKKWTSSFPFALRQSIYISILLIFIFYGAICVILLILLIFIKFSINFIFSHPPLTILLAQMSLCQDDILPLWLGQFTWETFCSRLLFYHIYIIKMVVYKLHNIKNILGQYWTFFGSITCT